MKTGSNVMLWACKKPQNEGGSTNGTTLCTKRANVRIATTLNTGNNAEVTHYRE
jgi:hypothetical protein